MTIKKIIVSTEEINALIRDKYKLDEDVQIVPHAEYYDDGDTILTEDVYFEVTIYEKG